MSRTSSTRTRLATAGRDWRAHWRDIPELTGPTTDDALRQVGKTVLGRPVPETQVDIIVTNIAERLGLTPNDRVLDMGCGNGLLTSRVAPLVARIAGIDVSESLLRSARTVHPAVNCTYHQGDLATLVGLPIEGVSKAFSYEVLQHLSTHETQALLDSLSGAFERRAILFIGSIPDRSLRRSFYDTPERWDHYHRNLAAGTEQIGHWWDRAELVALCEALHLQCEVHDQPGALYTAHYRFDAVISKP